MCVGHSEARGEVIFFFLRMTVYFYLVLLRGCGCGFKQAQSDFQIGSRAMIFLTLPLV